MMKESSESNEDERVEGSMSLLPTMKAYSCSCSYVRHCQLQTGRGWSRESLFKRDPSQGQKLKLCNPSRVNDPDLVPCKLLADLDTPGRPQDSLNLGRL